MTQSQQPEDDDGISYRQLGIGLHRLALYFESADPKLRAESNRIVKQDIGDVASEVESNA